jgi:cell division protein FtsI (penicillin-binding protein 3)
MSIKRDILVRVRIAFIVVILGGMAILYRIFHIQFNEGDRWNSMAESIGLKYMKVKATRGNIYSDDGSLLATSLPFYNVALDPTIATRQTYQNGIDSLSFLLSRHFKDFSAKEYKRKINDARVSGRRYIVLNRAEIDYQDKKMMSKWPILREGRMKGGVIFEKVNKRFRPFSYLGYRTIGLVNDDNRGVVGLEYSFNKYLAGQDGESLFQKMSGGGWRPIYDGTEIRPIDGLDIVTTININLQDIAESALLAGLKANSADYGSAVVMEVATGEIKAMTNLSRSSDGEYYERYNYAVGSQGSREPGSTFKLATILALLENSDIELTDSIDTGNGEYKFYDEVMKDHKPGGYGKMTVKEVFEKSSNIGIAKMTQEVFGSKPTEYINFIKKIGLADPIGFQMAGEGKPYIKTPSDSSWSGISLPWMSHGYELKLTPLHTLTLYNAIANNGKLIQPIIVKSVTTANRTIEEYEPKVQSGKICSAKTLAEVRELLEGVVERGTANNINDSYYKIAGKTGTAKTVINGRYTNKYYTSFAGYFPAEKPKYSCIVVIDNPKGYRIYGSDVAAPVFKRIADKIYSLDLEIQESKLPKHKLAGVFPVIRAGNQDELEMICNQFGISNHSKSESEWVHTDINNNSVIWKKTSTEGNTVPDVRGMTLRDAIFLLENKGVTVVAQGSGRVTEQSVNPGKKIVGREVITLKLG